MQPNFSVDSNNIFFSFILFGFKNLKGFTFSIQLYLIDLEYVVSCDKLLRVTTYIESKLFLYQNFWALTLECSHFTGTVLYNSDFTASFQKKNLS